MNFKLTLDFEVKPPFQFYLMFRFKKSRNVMIICKNTNSVCIVCLDYRPCLKKYVKQCDGLLTIDTNDSNPVLKDTTQNRIFKTCKSV